jgi:hypothetical protein
MQQLMRMMGPCMRVCKLRVGMGRIMQAQTVAASGLTDIVRAALGDMERGVIRAVMSIRVVSMRVMGVTMMGVGRMIWMGCTVGHCMMVLMGAMSWILRVRSTQACMGMMLRGLLASTSSKGTLRRGSCRRVGRGTGRTGRAQGRTAQGSSSTVMKRVVMASSSSVSAGGRMSSRGG